MKTNSKKLGAPKGHPKYERPEPIPTLTIEYSENKCPHCNSKLNSPTETKRIIEEEIPEPQPIRVVEHKINRYVCPWCHKKIVAKNKAPRGCFGKNVQTNIVLLKFEDRLPLRKVENSLCRNYGLKITNTGIYGITKQVAKKLDKPIVFKSFKSLASSKVIRVEIILKSAKFFLKPISVPSGVSIGQNRP